MGLGQASGELFIGDPLFFWCVIIVIDPVAPPALTRQYEVRGTIRTTHRGTACVAHHGARIDRDKWPVSASESQA